MAKTNEQVIAAFLNRTVARNGTASLTTDGSYLKSYSTAIARFDANEPGVLWITTSKFSPTTSRHISELAYAIYRAGFQATGIIEDEQVVVAREHGGFANRRTREIDKLGDGHHSVKFAKFARVAAGVDAPEGQEAA